MLDYSYTIGSIGNLTCVEILLDGSHDGRLSGNVRFELKAGEVRNDELWNHLRVDVKKSRTSM